MDANLHFIITRLDDSQITQDIKCPPDKVEAAINQIMAQYAQVGMLKKEGDSKYTLLPFSQIKLVECELSSLLIASPEETSKVAAAASSIKKIIT